MSRRHSPACRWIEVGAVAIPASGWLQVWVFLVFVTAFVALPTHAGLDAQHSEMKMPLTHVRLMA